MTLIPISGDIIKNHSRYGQTNFELTVEFRFPRNHSDTKIRKVYPISVLMVLDETNFGRLFLETPVLEVP